MGAKYGAATSLRSCCVVLGDQDGWGTNRLSKAESILGTGMSQNLSRGRRHACAVFVGLFAGSQELPPSGGRFFWLPVPVIGGTFIPSMEGIITAFQTAFQVNNALHAVHPHGCGELLRCQPWRAKRRLVDPSSREAALLTRRAHSARGEAK